MFCLMLSLKIPKAVSSKFKRHSRIKPDNKIQCNIQESTNIYPIEREFRGGKEINQWPRLIEICLSGDHKSMEYVPDE